MTKSIKPLKHKANDGVAPLKSNKEVFMLSNKTKVKRSVLFPDIHYPYQNKAIWSIMPRFLKDFKPDEVVLIGDAQDMRMLNHHELTKGNVKHFESKRLLADYKDFERDVINMINDSTKPDCKKVYMYGNHEAWVDNAINKCPSMLEGVIEIENNIDLSKWSIIPYINQDGQIGIHKIGKLCVIHGVYTNDNHTKKTAMVYGKSVVYGHCFDDKTELLTKEGWKCRQDISDEDVCLTMNKESGLLEWNKVNKKFVFDFNGEMVKVNGANVDLLVDGEHGLVIKPNKESKEYVYIKAQELSSRCVSMFKVSGKLAKEIPEYDIDDNMLKLLAWVISEGSIRYIGNTPYVDIVQSKEVGIGRIKDLLDSINGLTYLLKEKEKSPISKLQPYRFRIHADGSRIITKLLPRKDIVPGWFWLLSDRQAEVFIDEYIKGDGTVYTGKYKNQRMIYSTNVNWVDAFQARLFTLGYKTNVYWKTGSLKTNKLCAQINISKKEFIEVRSDVSVSQEKYKGKMWCVSVDNGTLVVRRNGLITVTQNTHDQQSYTQVFAGGARDYHITQSIGCMCDMSPDYLKGKPSKWVNGFAVVYSNPNGTFNVVQVVVSDNQFIFNGRVYKPTKPIKVIK